MPVKTVATMETLTRGCGCPAEMPVYLGEPKAHTDGRRNRLTTTRCTACGQKFSREHNEKQNATKPVKKGSEVKALPEGTFLVLRRREADWLGYLGDVECVNRIEAQASGLMALISKLARKWCVENGKKVSGKV
jgi:hypothetical protein